MPNPSAFSSAPEKMVLIEHYCGKGSPINVWVHKIDVKDPRQLEADVHVGTENCRKERTPSYGMSLGKETKSFLNQTIIPDMLDDLVHIFIKELIASGAKSIFEQIMLAAYSFALDSDGRPSDRIVSVAGRNTYKPKRESLIGNRPSDGKAYIYNSSVSVCNQH